MCYVAEVLEASQCSQFLFFSSDIRQTPMNPVLVVKYTQAGDNQNVTK